MTQTSSQELLDKVFRPGSSFYYSTLDLNDIERKRVGVLFAIFNEWLALRDNSSEPQVAHTALAWWMEQINLFSESQHEHMNHPLLHQLEFLQYQPELKTFVLARMQTILASFIQTPQNFEDTHSLDLYLRNTWGEFCAMYGALLSSNLSGYKNSALIQQQIGVIIGQYSINKQLAGQINRQRYLLPQSWLKDMDATQGQFVSSLKSKDSNPIKSQFITKMTQLLNSQLTELEQLLSADLDTLKFNHLPALIALNLDASLFNLTIKHGFNIFDYRLQLSPLRKLWIGWRCKRHYKKRHIAKLAAPG